MEIEAYVEKYSTFVFEYDDVLYPEKDYLLQVYYLFAQFIEYAEQKSSAETLDYLKSNFAVEGHDGIFERTAEAFGLDEKYKVNFDLLMENVRLPLKLLLFDEMLRFLTLIVSKAKRVILLVKGNPVMQLNKIRQTEWNGLGSDLTVYFTEELELPNVQESYLKVLTINDLDAKETILIGHSGQSPSEREFPEINFLAAVKLLP